MRKDEAGQELDFWESKADTLENAKAAIAASEEAWSGEILEACLEQILPTIDAAPHRKGHGPRVLDLGCGAGRLTIPIAQRRPKAELCGVDISHSMLVLASSRTEGAKIAWHLGDGRSLPAEVGRLDAAYSMIMMQHVPRAAQANYIYEVAQALVRGGLFRFQVLEGEEQTFLHHYVTDTWVSGNCLEAGLHVVEINRIRPFASTDDAPNALWVTARK